MRTHLNSCIGYSLFLHVLLLLNMTALSLIEWRCIVITLRFIKITTVKGFLVLYNTLSVDLYALIPVCVSIIILLVFKLFLSVLFLL